MENYFILPTRLDIFTLPLSLLQEAGLTDHIRGLSDLMEANRYHQQASEEMKIVKLFSSLLSGGFPRLSKS